MHLEHITLTLAPRLPGPVFTPQDVEAIPAEKGSYILLLKLDKSIAFELPRLGQLTFTPGLYAYCGSANGPGGLRARLRRHFKKDKKLHWHVDRLTMAASEMAAFTLPGGNECVLAADLTENAAFEIPAPGFGSTDCATCRSHLFKALPTPPTHLA